LHAGAGNMAFASTVTGAFALTANSPGTTTFGGAVNVATLPATPRGTTALNGGSVTTTADQIYNDAVTLGAATTLDAGAGNITFASTDPGAFPLAANNTGRTTFGGAVNVASLTTNAGGTTALNGGSVTT